MNREPLPSDVQPTGETWQEIDASIEEIARLSKSDIGPSDFHAEFLRSVVSGLSAVGGMIWAAEFGGLPRLQHRIVPAGMPSPDDADLDLRRLALAAMETGRARLAAPCTAPADGDGAANPTEFLLLVCPWSAEDAMAGAVVVFHRPGDGPEAQRGCLHFLEAMCELLADFHRYRQLRDYRQRAGQWRLLDQFAEQVHHSLDLEATAYTIANEGRRLLECDRVSVLVCRSGKCRLLAVSGVDAVDRRAGTVRHLERLAAAVARFDEPVRHPGREEDRPPEIASQLDAYLDESHARAIAVIPLKAPGKDGGAEGPDRPSTGGRPATLGVLVAERFRGEFGERPPGPDSPVVRHSAVALSNAMELDRVPMARALRCLGKARWFVEIRRFPKTLLALAAVAGVAAFLSLAPADFRIEAPGELQPVVARDVFAPADGVVTEVRTAHGRKVLAGQVVLALENPDLDLEFKRVWGELQTVRKKLASVEAERLQNPRENEEHRRRYGELTAQHEELREQIAGLEAQYAILQKRQSELEVRSPMDGEVLTWNIEQLLEARPVNRGQALMTVADLNGPWQLELRIADHRVAHVLAAQRQSGRSLEVSFVAAGEPSVQRRGVLSRIGMRTEVAEPDGAFVLAYVDIDRNEISSRMPGATATAKIDCGRRSVGYVWLHDLIDAVRIWFWF
ncbi:MAG: HlyD family efflux transporter periplasmic adaptor subunit [Pirellulales bacterium]|nr:HlyD family efflux transporter periplasmic adaptor subunit [Pirellulales bacterium]